MRLVGVAFVDETREFGVLRLVFGLQLGDVRVTFGVQSLGLLLLRTSVLFALCEQGAKLAEIGFERFVLGALRIRQRAAAALSSVSKRSSWLAS